MVKDHAPLPFRQLQGNKATIKQSIRSPRCTRVKLIRRVTHPMNKRETEGGIFRCRLGGHDLELFARGMRNRGTSA